jgi:hypothetical protein
VKIYGAGMAGLLAANVLRRFQPEVHEVQPSLPNNHAALLRFRTDICSKATGIPFRKVTVHKAVSYRGTLYAQSTIALNNMYSYKVTGRIVDRSVINLVSGDRYIAPDDFISQMAASVSIKFNSPLGEEIRQRDGNSSPIISTLPMPLMMKLVGWKTVPKFESRKVWSVRATLDRCDVYQTIYYPDPELECYRASITGNLLIVECLSCPVQLDKVLWRVMGDFGIVKPAKRIEVKEQEYGKLIPPDDPSELRRFVLFLTDQYRIYSLGRFATWRQILLDEVVNDIHVIERLIEFRDGYRANLEKSI